jgi:hypothetical protein
MRNIVELDEEKSEDFLVLWYENISKDFMDEEKYEKTVLWISSIRQRLTLQVFRMV